MSAEAASARLCGAGCRRHETRFHARQLDPGPGAKAAPLWALRVCEKPLEPEAMETWARADSLVMVYSKAVSIVAAP